MPHPAPKPAPQQARSLRKREQLLAVALRHFADFGYEATTAKAIADAAGIAVGTFYQHFANKDEVLLALAELRFGELQRQIIAKGLNDTDGVQPLLSAILELLYDFHRDEPGFHEVLDQRRKLDARLGALQASGEAALLAHTQQLVARYQRNDVKETAYCLFAMAEGLVHRHVFYPSRLSRKKIISTGVTLLAAGFESMSEKV